MSALSTDANRRVDYVEAHDHEKKALTVLGPILILLCFFVLSQSFAFVITPTFDEAGMTVFEDPGNIGNTVQIIIAILIFTALTLLIAWFERQRLIQVIILVSVFITLLYVLIPFVLPLTAYGDVVALTLALLLTALLYFYPEWYVIDVAGIFMAGGIAAILGISLGLIPVIVLLVILAVYDFISVYKTKHMISLADSVLDLHLPLLFIAPKKLPYSFLKKPSELKEKIEKGEEREALFMGVGDVVIPTMLVVSALNFIDASANFIIALSAMLGTLVGFGILMYMVARGRPQAGLPLLNGGAIIGFALSYVMLIGL